MKGAERPVISIDVDPDRSAAAIAAAWHEPDGKIGTDLVFYRSGDLSDLLAGVEKVTRDPPTDRHRLRPLDDRGHR